MPGVFVFGSCVSRDTRAFLDEEWVLTGYVARQGFLSATSGRTTLRGQPDLSSPFQRRCLEWDLGGEALDLIEAEARRTDIVLVDLVDERLGSYQAPDGTYVTNSWEFGCSGLLSQQADPLKLVEFGSERHFELWSQAASTVLERLDALALRTLILAPDWAEVSDEGKHLGYRGSSISEWNAKYRRYYERCADLGAAVIRPPESLAVAATGHKWGLAPYHYIDSMYEYICEEITDFMRISQ